MRIVAGQYRGLKLASLSGQETRPTADRVREAIFSSLFQRVQKARVLDFYAGTGAMGLEALSRGAKESVFCEYNKKTLAVLKKNIALCRAEHSSVVCYGDALTAVKRGCVDGQFDLIFVDPPYQGEQYEKTLQCIAETHLLADKGMIIIESSKKPLFSIDNTVFLLYKNKTYGETCVTYLVSKE